MLSSFAVTAFKKNNNFKREKKKDNLVRVQLFIAVISVPPVDIP